MKKLARIVRHAIHHKRAARKTFSAEDLAEIGRAVRAAKEEREAEIRVVVENSLSGKRLARGTSPQRRGMEIFAKHHVWDTDFNNGILIYILLADRHVAVIADRGLTRSIPPEMMGWNR
jgi:uncharacterized membrane protein